MTATRTLESGQRVSEYVLEERLGRGGFGEVWRARHHARKERVVAAKVPLDDEGIRSLTQEAFLQNSLDSPHVVRTLGLDAAADPPYILMDFVDGESLRALLSRRVRLEPHEARAIARQVAEALRDVHRKGVVHRDLKPENVLIDKAGVAYVSDFGLGQIVGETASRLVLSGSMRTREGGDLAGTIQYMAPEQRTPGQAVDARADIYSFGIVLFEMLTGALPEGAELPSERVLDLDPDIDHVFSRCYTRLGNRYPDAEALLLAAFRGPQAIPAWFAYETLMVWLFGRTLGKIVVGVRVVRDVDLGRVRFFPALWRTFVKGFGTIYFAWLFIPMSAHGRSIHDHAADTRTILSRRRAA